MCATIFVQISAVAEKIWSTVSLCFWSKWVTVQFNYFSNWTGIYQLFSKFSLIKQVLFSYWIILFQKYIIFGQNFKISLEAYLYYLQIKFKYKFLLSSTYVIQFYKGDSPSWEEKGWVHSFETMVNETL